MEPCTNHSDLDIVDINDNERNQEEGGSGYQIENVFLLYPDSSLTPEEKVFSIDHVLESIFSELDETDLLASRLVCRRWAHFATKPLQSTVYISFHGSFKPDSIDYDIFKFETNKGRPFQQLVDLMNNSHEFHCTSFYFSNCCTSGIVTSDLEPLFRLHASQIENLKFEGVLAAKDLTRLICTRALNLKYLELKDVEVTNHDDDDYVAVFQDSEPVLKNLKVFTCDSPIPESIINLILESSLNLSQIFLHHKILPCLIKRTSPFQFLNILVIGDAEENTIAKLELIAKNNLKNNFEIQQIQFSKFDAHLKAPPQNYVDAMTKILKGCSGTFKKFAWSKFLENYQFQESFLCFKSNM